MAVRYANRRFRNRGTEPPPEESTYLDERAAALLNRFFRQGSGRPQATARGPRTDIPTGPTPGLPRITGQQGPIAYRGGPRTNIQTGGDYRAGRMPAYRAGPRTQFYGQQADQQQQQTQPSRRFAQGGGYQGRYGARILKPVSQMTPQELQQYALNQPPSAEKGSVAFNAQLPRAGAEFQQYLLEQGVMPGGLQRLPGQAVSGAYTDWLLRRYNLTQHGINPYARPITLQQGQQTGQGGGYGGGYGGYGGGGGGRPLSFGGGGGRAPQPQFRGRAPFTPNVPRWMQLMANWQIG